MNHTHSALFTDLYELTMIQGYYRCHENHEVVFDMFFRRQPFDGGFTVFAGVDDLIDRLEQFSFSDEDIDYLRTVGLFEDGFLEYLSDFKFTGEVHAVPEGSIVFPNEPHGLSRAGRTDRRVARLEWICRWFERYLKDESATEGVE